MIKRYPHTGVIKVNVETENGTSTPDISLEDVVIKGRYEPASQNRALDYSAKWFCKKSEIEPFEVDGNPLIYNGKQFKIVQMFPYQTHCEIWLE